MANKVRELAEVVRSIPKGAQIACGSFAITRNPIAFSNELIRQKKRGLAYLQIIGGMDADMLIGAGVLNEYSYGGGVLDRFGKVSRINEAIEKKSLPIFEYSGMSMSLKFLAGSLGVSYIPSKTLLGTDVLNSLLERGADLQIDTCPFTGEKQVLFRAFNPDFAVIHAPAADEKGNVIIEGPIWDEELAKSADKLIVTVDRIVSNAYVKQNPHLVKIPNIYTHAVVPVPFGAYPTSVFKEYDYDGDFITKYVQANKTQESFDDFLNTYVYGTKNHTQFLEKAAGLERLNQLRADPVYGYKKL